MKKAFTCAILVLALPIFLLAQFDDCLSGWVYYKEITIDNTNNTEDLQDFQFKFTVNTGDLVSEGKLQSDGADIRFVAEDCSLIHYYMDSTATSTANVIWLRVPFLAASSQATIRMYYGNSEAAIGENGESTFLFFDNFDAPEVDTNKWETVGEYATFQITDGTLDYASTSMNPGPRFKFARSKASWSGDVDIDFTAQVGTSQAFGLSSADSLIERYYFRYQNGSQSNDTMNLIAIIGDTISNGYAVDVNYPLLNISKNVLTDLSIRPRVDEFNKLFLDRFMNVETGQTNDEVKDLGPFEMSGFHFVISSFSPNFHVYLDEFKVRKIIDNMPSTSIGPEENNPATTQTNDFQFEGVFEISPNPASDYINVVFDWENNAVLEIFNLYGQLVMHKEVSSGHQSMRIPVKDLVANSYIIQLKDATTGQFLTNRKLIISK